MQTIRTLADHAGSIIWNIAYVGCWQKVEMWQYSFVAERFKIHSLWPRRSRGFKLWILKREYTKRFDAVDCHAVNAAWKYECSGRAFVLLNAERLVCLFVFFTGVFVVTKCDAE